jgi:serine/threonine protein kinase
MTISCSIYFFKRCKYGLIDKIYCPVYQVVLNGHKWPFQCACETVAFVFALNDVLHAEVMLCPDKRAPDENKANATLAYNAKVDAWACGVLAYELLVGCPPFGMSTREGSVKAILYQKPKVPQWLAPAAADFITWALTKKASRRPSVSHLLQHPWIVSHTFALPLLLRKLIR